MKVHSPSLKALENPRTVSFKRYFLGNFVDNSDIFVTALLVQEERILIPVSYFLFIVIIVLVNFLSPCPPFSQLQLQLKLSQDAIYMANTDWENERKWWVHYKACSGAKSNNCFWPVSTATVLLLWLCCCQLTVSCKSSLNFQKIRFLFFKCHSPWTLRRFEIKWVNFYSNNLNDFAQVFVIRNVLSSHGGLIMSQLCMVDFSGYKSNYWARRPSNT